MQKHGILFIISGPSGSGKDTIIGKLLEKLPNVALSKSCTTRKVRSGETKYFHVEKPQFLKMIEQNELLEYAEYLDNFYGTPKKFVEDELKKGNNVVLEIEVQGAAKIRHLMPNAVGIFIEPPSLEVLRERLSKRGTEIQEVIDKRVETAKIEIAQASQYNYTVINDDLKTAIDEITTIIINENNKT